MKSRIQTLALLAMISTACAATPPQSTSPPPSAAQAASSPSSVASQSADVFTGTGATAETTCPEQISAAEAAGFTAEQMTAVGLDPACVQTSPHGSQFTIRFTDGALVVFQDGEVGWDGLYRVIDDQTFEAGDLDAGYYITYGYAIDGDQLNIDMIDDAYPIEADAVADSLIQTVIYETSQFTRQN